MDEILDFARAIEDAKCSIEQAIDYGNDVTHGNWPEMNDYLNQLQELLSLLGYPPGVDGAIAEAEKAFDDGDARQDALSY